VIRVGLESDLAEFAVPAPGAPWIVSAGGRAELRRGPLRFRSQGSPAVVRIQAGAFSEEPSARSAAADLEKRTGLPASVVFSAEKGLYLVRAGAFADIPSARAAAQAAGLDGFPVAEGSTPGTLTVADGSGAETGVPGGVADVAPPADGIPVTCKGKSYRGRLRVSVNSRGSINVVNVVNLEDYLRGVVPAEMGPKRFDELEALKAQAIAARTYAVDNVNGFASEGYDLCATPKCQVYSGLEGEDPLSDAAVEQTRGEMALWQGKPIHALFTSTCGGATEDASLVFASMSAPYLSGVTCGEQEKSSFEGARVPRASRGLALTALEWRGWVLTRRAAGTRSRTSRAAAWEEALRLAGITPRGGPPASLQPAAVYPAVLSAFGLVADRDVHLTKTELDYAAGPPDPASALPADARAALLTLSRLRFGGDAGLPPPTRAMSELEFDGLLMSVALRMGGVTETSGHLARRDGGSFVIKTAAGRTPVSADTSVDLARSVDGRFYPASEVSLTSGDPVVFWKRGNAVLALWTIETGAGGTFEKESTWTEWIQRVPARKLAIRLASRVPGTEVRTITIRKRGASGRVAEAAIETDRATAILKGFDLRQALQLPELIFTVQKVSAADGTPEFLFIGRGWGHGVGLCQNGAYGMALAGHSAEEILKHYYPGIDIAPLPPPPAVPAGTPPPAAPAPPPSSPSGTGIL
jgi:stage II sporulation protein D